MPITATVVIFAIMGAGGTGDQRTGNHTADNCSTDTAATATRDNNCLRLRCRFSKNTNGSGRRCTIEKNSGGIRLAGFCGRGGCSKKWHRNDQRGKAQEFR